MWFIIKKLKLYAILSTYCFNFFIVVLRVR